MAPGIVQVETVHERSIALNGAFDSDSLHCEKNEGVYIDLVQDSDELLRSSRSSLSKLANDKLDALELPTVFNACWIVTILCFTPANILYLHSDPAIGFCKVSHVHEPGSSILEFDPEERLIDLIMKLHTLKSSQNSTQEQAAASNSAFLASAISYSQTSSLKPLREETAAAAAKPVDHGLMTLKLIQRPNKLSAALVSLPKTVSKDFATSLLSTFKHALSSARTSLSLPVASLKLCSDLDIARIQNLTRDVSPASTSLLHELAFEHGKNFPNDPAIESWDNNFTYRELDEATSKLAQYLAALGVGPETFVLSCFEKSSWAIVARLAIMKAGGAYISIDATDPPGYLTSLVARVGAKIMLVSSGYESRYSSIVESVIPITKRMVEHLPPVIQPVHSKVKASNACLILFTSGTTGQPKGIIQEHRSYAVAVQDYIKKLDMGNHSRVFQFDDYAFDISNNDYLTALIAGGVCCVPTPEKTIQGLISNVNSLRANTSFMTPTVAVRVQPEEIPTMKLLCLGGEPMSNDLLTRWSGHVRLVNQYGMGEAATFCCYHDRPQPGDHSIVGLPGPGTVWITNPSSPEIPVPVGAVGEILIEGPHLSRGYLDDVCLKPNVGFLKTIPKWIAELHPERAESTRIYRSGDLGRYTADGRVQHMGRKDTMLKMNGSRIESTEVEYILRQSLPSPRDAVIVDLLGDIDGVEDPALTAFIFVQCNPLNLHLSEPNEKMTFTPITETYAAYEIYEKMKNETADIMPEYMFPTLFLLVDRIPKTKSNKTDRRKLHQLAQEYYMSSTLR